jgi:hypothetical protein
MVAAGGQWRFSNNTCLFKTFQVCAQNWINGLIVGVGGKKRSKLNTIRQGKHDLII